MHSPLRHVYPMGAAHTRSEPAPRVLISSTAASDGSDTLLSPLAPTQCPPWLGDLTGESRVGIVAAAAAATVFARGVALHMPAQDDAGPVSASGTWRGQMCAQATGRGAPIAATLPKSSLPRCEEPDLLVPVAAAADRRTDVWCSASAAGEARCRMLAMFTCARFTSGRGGWVLRGGLWRDFSSG